MFEISQYTMEQLKDPYGIIAGERYEFMLDLQIDEEDELYSETGVVLRVIAAVQDEEMSISKYEFLSASTNQYIALEMEEEEYAMVEAFCKEQLKTEEEG